MRRQSEPPTQSSQRWNSKPWPRTPSFIGRATESWTEEAMSDDDREIRPSVGGGLEELTEDMLQVMGRLVSIEKVQVATGARLDEIQRAVMEMSMSHGRVLDALRRDLVGERK